MKLLRHLAVALLAPAAASAAPVLYAIDPSHTFVTVEVRHFGTSTMRVRFGGVVGSVELDREAGRGSVSLQLPTAGVDTGVPPSEYAALFDTVYVSLWKSFSSGSGAILAGRSALLDDIYEERRMFGGALFSAWPFAAVARHAYAIDPKTQTMLVEADVPNADLSLRPGMFVTARIGVDRHDGVWTLPIEAVLVEKATRSVFVVENGVARKRTVETGFDDGRRFEITKGITGDETVLVPVKARLADGDAVRVEAMR